LRSDGALPLFFVRLIIRTIFDTISPTLFPAFAVLFLFVGADEKSEAVPAC
jgi:hypothetical protein